MSEELKAAQARIAELEGALSWHEEQRNDMAELRAELEHRNKLISDMQAAWDMALHTIGRQNAELAAIKAQEPAFMWHKGATEDESEVVDVDCACPCCVPLYAAPVSEAKAQGVYSADPLACSGCASGCFRCRDVAKVQGVVMPEPLMAAITRADDVLHALSNWESSSVKLEQRHGPEWTKEVDAIRRELHTQLARLNAAPVQQVSVPDVSAMARTLADRSADACNVNREDNWAIHGQDYIDDVTAMLAAAPAAPAADAGLAEALKQAFPLFDEDGLNELYHHCEIAVLGDRKRLHKLLAAHSAKGVL